MKLLDSHIHVWSHSHLETLAWQSADHPLHFQYSINEYVQAIRANTIPFDDFRGFIFVEADRKFSFDPLDWTQPVNEFKYALSIYRGEDGEGYANNTSLLRALVAWGPVPLGAEGMTKYTAELRSLCSSDSELRGLLKGFRYLIQNKPLRTCTDEKFVDGVRWCGDNGYLFELGVDFQNRGTAQLNEAVQLVRRAPNTVFIIGMPLAISLNCRPYGKTRFAQVC
jgi:L-rhamnono-1,4-lactonase